MRSDPMPSCRLASLARIGSTATLAIAVVAVAPVYAAPPCQFDRPMGSSSGRVGTLTTTLMQAYVSCANPGGNVPNTTTVGGVPSCAPPETFHQQAGSPANGWRFSQNPGSGSYGKVYMKRTSASANLPGFPQTQRDLYVKVTLSGVVNNDGNTPASGNGTLAAVMRVTTEDYENGEMTVVDFPFSFTVPVVNGSASVVKKLGDLMTSIGQPHFPDCSAIEVVSISIMDRNGNIFAVPGLKLRDR